MIMKGCGVVKGLWRYNWPFNLWGLFVLAWWRRAATAVIV
jgi:hypothetical protein